MCIPRPVKPNLIVKMLENEVKQAEVYKLSFRRATVQRGRVAVLGLFLEFPLSVEFMEPGQLSISLYSVCKISDLNTKPLSVAVGFFFCATSVLLVRITSVHYGLRQGCCCFFNTDANVDTFERCRTPC